MEAADRKNGMGLALAGFAVVLAVCLPLLCKTLGHGHNNDWPNHCWMANYFARYFANHLAFPHTLNTSQLVGMAYPVFYGYLFYPVVGLCSTLFDANITLRVLAVIALAVQFIFLYKSAVFLLKDKLFAFTLSTLVTWAIYPLTNLYHRAAIPEFFACIFLTCASVAWIRAITAPSISRLQLWCNLSILCLCAAAGTHPITAVYGIVAFALQLVIGLVARPTFSAKKIMVALALPTALSVICLAPWVVNARRYSHDFQVAGGFDKVGYYMLSVDSPSLRLSPVPLPSAMLKEQAAQDHMNTLHLDAQINVPLALMFASVVFALWRRKKLDWRLAGTVALLAVLVVWMIHISVTFGAMSKLGSIARCIQFAYRLVTYINLMILVGILFCAAHFGRTRRTEAGVETAENGGEKILARGVLALVLALSAVAVAMKISYAFELEPIEHQFFSSQRSDAAILQLPSTFYGLQAYALPRMLNELSEEDSRGAGSVTFNPRCGRKFAEVASVPLPFSQQRWISTNVQEFAWNKLSLNGRPLDTSELAGSDMKIAVKNWPGGVLSYDFRPSASWSQLNSIAIPLFFLWLVATWASFVRQRASQSESQAAGDYPGTIQAAAAATQIARR